MGKNQTGGNKAKRQGRKFAAPNASKLRVALEDGEVYAVVTKHFGNAMLDVMSIDGVNRLCIIRNKFRGRGKRDNCVNVGTWILVGEREWEMHDNGKKPKCDLIEVYSQAEVEQLKKTANNWHVLTSAVDTENSDMHKDAVKFVDSDTPFSLTRGEYIQQQDISTNIQSTVEDDEIDFDDI